MRHLTAHTSRARRRTTRPAPTRTCGPRPCRGRARSPRASSEARTVGPSRGGRSEGHAILHTTRHLGERRARASWTVLAGGVRGGARVSGRPSNFDRVSLPRPRSAPRWSSPGRTTRLARLGSSCPPAACVRGCTPTQPCSGPGWERTLCRYRCCNEHVTNTMERPNNYCMPGTNSYIYDGWE